MSGDGAHAADQPTRLLDAKRIVVTGAGAGLGRAYARHLAAQGALLVINDIDADAAERVAAEITERGGHAVAHPADVARWDEAKSVIEAAKSAFGGLDGLVNNAGIQVLGTPDRFEADELRRVVEVNLLGTLHCGTHAIRVMTEQRQGGTIVNVTSGAHMGLPRMAPYAATKGAIASLTHCWAIDLRDAGIRCNAISPLAATSMAAANARFEGRDLDTDASLRSRFLSPEANAPVVAFLLSDASAPATGQIIRLDPAGLSLVSHPLLLPTQAPGSAWTVETIAAALSDDILDTMPLGIKQLSADGAIALYKTGI